MRKHLAVLYGTDTRRWTMLRSYAIADALCQRCHHRTTSASRCGLSPGCTSAAMRATPAPSRARWCPAAAPPTPMLEDLSA